MSDSDNDDMDNKFDNDSSSEEEKSHNSGTEQKPEQMKESMIKEQQNSKLIDMTMPMKEEKEQNSTINTPKPKPKPKRTKSYKENKNNNDNEDITRVLDSYQENIQNVSKKDNNEKSLSIEKKNDSSNEEKESIKQEVENKGFAQNQDERKGFGREKNGSNNNDRNFEGAKEFQGFRKDDNRNNEQTSQEDKEFRGFGRDNEQGPQGGREFRGFGNDTEQGFQGDREFRGFGTDNDRGLGRGHRGNNNFRGGERSRGTRGFSSKNNNRDFEGEREFQGFGGGGYNKGNDRGFNRDYRRNDEGRFNNGRGWGNNRRASNNRGRNFRNYNNNNDGNNTGSHFYSNNATRVTPLEKDPFYISHKSLILDIKDIYKGLVEKDIIQILKIITLNSSRTIFEIMNEIARQNKIMLTLKEKEKSFKREYDERMEIIELPYAKDAVSEFEQIIKDYKVYSQNEDQDKEVNDEFYYTSENERRRPLKKDKNGHYNYVPTYSPYSPSSREQNNIDEIYAKNPNEINYHSLTYKTVVCRKAICTDKHCPNAHGMGEDFRIIYDYRDDDICKLMRKLMDTTSLRIESYLEHFEIPKSFSLADFKIHKCPLNPQCNYDRHLCMMYHSEEEKRRPPKLFRYENERCQYAQESKNAPFKPELCPFGIFCWKIHSITEFNYHEENFGKIFRCNREKKNGKCIFYQTCYGIHNSSDEEDNEEEGDEEDEEEEDEDDEGDKKKDKKKKKKKDKEKSKKQEKKYENLFKEKEELLNKFICPKCKTLPSKQTYCMLNECKHVVCKNCFKASRKEKGKPPLCPICGIEIQKGGAILVQFKQNES